MPKAKTCVIVQARMGSTRLPGKVMKTIVGKPMLELMIERLKQAGTLDGIIIATTEKETEKPIIELVESLGEVLLFRGSENDVLGRYYEAAILYNVETVVRVTSDCPLIEPAVTDRVVNAYHARKEVIDYASNIRERTYPRGLDVEVFSFESLQKAFNEATLQPDREHVTEYILQRPNLFRMYNVVDDYDRSGLRWTVDTQEDFDLITKIYELLYYNNPHFTYPDILRLLDQHPDWIKINAHVEQKIYGQ